MLKKLFTLLFISIIFSASFSYANVIILQPSGPVTFGTVNGGSGLGSEILTGGNIAIDAGGAVKSAALDATGVYSLTVGAGPPLSINANYFLQGMPNVSARFRNIPALAENEVRIIDLTRPSGRVFGRVNVIGGELDQIILSAYSFLNNSGVLENYSSYMSASRVGDVTPEGLLSMPAGIATDFYASIKATSYSGCVVEKDFRKNTIVVQDAILSTGPDFVEWVIDVSAVTCDNGSINGDFQLNGLDPVSILGQHTLSFIGPDTSILGLVQFGPYQTGPLLEGAYSVLQTSTFKPPYGTLRFPVENIDVPGNGSATYDSVHSVGMAHGVINLAGDWDYSHITSAEAATIGFVAETSNVPAYYIFANDNIDLTTGNYDFVLTTGKWDINNFNFNFESLLDGRTEINSFNLRLLPGLGLGAHTISEGQQLILPPISLDTTITQINLQVEQQPGQAPVTIDHLNILGFSQSLNPPADAIVHAADFDHNSYGTQQSEFSINLYGLSGAYIFYASGIGSDGVLYESTFELALDEQVAEPEPFPCFAVNHMKVHMHDGKIYINDAVFSVPDNATIDLSQTDVVFSIDGLAYTIPAGSFIQLGSKQDYAYKTPHDQVPAIKARLNFDKSEWSLKVKDPNAIAIDNTDGVDVSLTIGSYQGFENIMLVQKHDDEDYIRSRYKHYRVGGIKFSRKHDDDGEYEAKLRYKRHPKVSCGSEDEDEDEDEDEHHDHDHHGDEDEASCGKKGKSRRGVRH